jgi:tetratricopeptide (TPR) repeat protein
VRLAEAYGAQGNFREAMAALEQVVARDEKDARAWYLLGRYAIENGDAQKAADDYLVRALLLQTRLENRAGQAEVTNALGLAYQLLGQLDDAVKRFREAAEQRRALGDRDGLAVAQKNLGNALLAKGDVGGAERALADALTVQQELQPARVAELETAYGALEEERGRYPAALERYKRALKLRQDLGDEAALAESRDDVGYTYYLLGDYDNARFNLDAALALFEKHGNPGGALLVRQGQGACQLAQGQWREAIETFHDSLERSKKLDMDDARAVAHGSLARLAYLEGRYGAALASYVEASKLVERLGDRRGQAEYALGEAETLLAIESLPAAAERLAKVDGWRREGLSREQQALLTLLQGRLRARRGERPAARQAFAAAAQAAAAISSVPLELEARLGAALAEPTPPAAELRKVLAQAQALGHAALELEAAEALARAELAAGRARPAEELLRAALQRQRRVGSWRRGFALHQLLAAAYRKRGATAEAASELAAAQAEAKRVIESVPKEQRGAFFSLAELRELTSSG